MGKSGAANAYLVPLESVVPDATGLSDYLMRSLFGGLKIVLEVRFVLILLGILASGRISFGAVAIQQILIADCF